MPRKPRSRGKRGKGKKGTKVDEQEKKEGFRFSTAVLDSPSYSIDTTFSGLNLSAYGTELIKDAELSLAVGRRYGLLGNNGSGKTQLLKTLALREVPIPEHIDIFYLEKEEDPSEMSAFDTVIKGAKDTVERLEKEVEDAIEEHGPDADLVIDLYERLDDLEPNMFEVTAGRLLHGLGFSKERMHQKCKDLSGGWRMRVALAKALFVRPTLLILDEPTNHLDLEAVVWLERHLAKYPRCLVFTSHSQDFMNNVCTHIIHITPKKQLITYTGNYAQFVKTKTEAETHQLKKYTKQQADIKKLKQFIASAGTYSNLVKQAKSKQKIIDKINEDLAEKPQQENKFQFRFTNVRSLPPPVLVVDKVSFSYSGKEEDYLYEKVSVGADLDSRIAIVGPNGVGKSTLLKLICGDLTPCDGQIRRHLNLRLGRYHQHSAEQLDNDMTPLDFMLKTFPEEKLSSREWRSQLGRFGISGDNQGVKIGTLSDGLKSRLVFSMIALKTPNMLLLDEPTNHLDVNGINALANAINNFNGGCVLVSHDFVLLEKVAQEIWVVDDKTITTWKGTIQEYKAFLANKIDKEAESKEEYH